MSDTIKMFCVLLIYCFVVQITAQEDNCTPLYVSTLEVTDNLTLVWTPNPENNCTVSYYLLYIWSREVETLYMLEEMYMDVSFLPTCESARFTLIPVSSEGIRGGIHMHGRNMPIPPGANITIKHLSIQPQPADNFLLSWELEEEYKYCVWYFRVLIYHEYYDEPVDIYAETNSTLLQHISPCEPYTFGVRPIYSFEEQGPIALIRYTSPSRRMAQPSLQSIVLGTSNVDLQWQLETYEHNRCEVSSISIEALPHFRVTYPVRDNPNRPIVSTRITSLEADTIYFMNVTVINIAGPSVPFLIAVQTLANN